jgi:ferrochelatase
LKTTELVKQKLGLEDSQVKSTFQSRLGKDKWIEPYTDETLENLPKNGVKNLAIVCPAFVSDCLETLEEISVEGKEEFYTQVEKNLITFLVLMMKIDG